MIIGKVEGSVISTRKNDKLVGSKLLIIKPLEGFGNSNGKIIAVDNVGAGYGEMVLVTLGSSAKNACHDTSAPIDAAVVGIIDEENVLR